MTWISKRKKLIFLSPTRECYFPQIIFFPENIISESSDVSYRCPVPGSVTLKTLWYGQVSEREIMHATFLICDKFKIFRHVEINSNVPVTCLKIVLF